MSIEKQLKNDTMNNFISKKDSNTLSFNEKEMIDFLLTTPAKWGSFDGMSITHESEDFELTCSIIQSFNNATWGEVNQIANHVLLVEATETKRDSMGNKRSRRVLLNGLTLASTPDSQLRNICVGADLLGVIKTK